MAQQVPESNGIPGAARLSRPLKVVLSLVIFMATGLAILSVCGGYAYSMFMIGNAYGQGWWVRADQSEANAWFRKAARAGSAKAEFNLGVAYMRGFGVPVDESQAYGWLRKSADHGDTHAKYLTALCYLTGIGVPKNQAAGIDLLRLAAEQGYVDAQSALAGEYLAGVNTPQNLTLALDWYRKAANQGLESAKPKVAKLEQQLKVNAREVSQPGIATRAQPRQNASTPPDTDREVRGATLHTALAAGDTVGSLDGQCTKYVAMDVAVDLSLCSPKLASITFRSGIVSFLFVATAKDGAVSVVGFFGPGPKEIHVDKNHVTLPINRVKLTFEGATDTLNAVGSCSYGNPYLGRPVKISCEAKTSHGGFSGEFITNGVAPSSAEM